MYNEFFGLQKSPFDLTPDPEFLYPTRQHCEALAGLTYALLARKGFVALTGDAGTGKTTLLSRVIACLPGARIQCSLIVNPTLTPAEFLESAMLGFGFNYVPASKAQRIVALHSFLSEGCQQGRILALVVDEAHKLSLELLEEIRLLGNLELGNAKLLQIALVGQNELDDLLNSDHLRPLRQRIAMRLALQPLAAAEVERYIGHRWAKAGGSRAPFTYGAVNAISRASQGLPRLINSICDNALMQAFGEGSHLVEEQHVAGVCTELRLSVSGAATAGTAPVKSPAAAAEPIALMPIATDWSLKTLERYGNGASRPSVLSRLAAKLRPTQRIGTA